jgi:hypothetical protein
VTQWIAEKSVLAENVAAWGLFEKREVETLQRVASARTMDGFKIRAKLALNFPRALTTTEAEELMMQYARAFATAVECELSNGDLPFEEHELLQRITEQVTALPKKNVRLIGLHVWHKGAMSSRSMLAVKPEPEGNPTVPAMPAVKGPPPAQTMSSSNLQAAAAAKPSARTPDPPSPVPGLPNRSRTAVTQVTPAVSAETAPPSSRNAAAVSGVTTRVMAPAVRVAIAGSGQNLPSPASSASMAAARPAPASSRLPPSSAQPQTDSFPAAARMASGVMPAVETRIRTKSGFATAVERCVEGKGEEVGRALAQPVRDAAAEALLSALGALASSIPDPLSLLDGRADAELRRGLVGEACVYVCYVLYEALTRTSLPQMQAIQVVQGACMQALLDQNMPVSEISRYLATESPREEFTGRLCALFGVRETPEMQQRVETHLRSLRLDVRGCSEQIEQRLTRAKSSSEQKTG